MNYLYVFFVFIAVKIIKYLLKKHNQGNNYHYHYVKSELKDELIPYEEQYNIINPAPIIHLRVATVFYVIQDPQERENLRNKMVEIVKREKAKPIRNVYLFISNIIIQLFAIYTIFFTMYEPTQHLLAFVLLGITIIFWLSSRQYIFAVIFAIIGVLIYFKLPSTVVFFLILNMFSNLLKKIIVYMKTKRKRNESKD